MKTPEDRLSACDSHFIDTNFYDLPLIYHLLLKKYICWHQLFDIRSATVNYIYKISTKYTKI